MDPNYNQVINFRDFYLNDEEIWFSGVEINGLFKQNIKSSKVEFIATFPKEDSIQDNLHSQIIEYNKNLYFIPLEGKGISIYDCERKNLRLVNCKYADKCFFIKALKINDDIFLIPMNSLSHFCVFHTQTETFELLDDLEKNIASIIKRELFWTDNSLVDVGNRYLYLVPSENNIIVTISLDNKFSVKTHKVENVDSITSIMIGKEEKYIYLCSQDTIYKYDLVNENIGIAYKLSESKEKYYLASYDRNVICMSESMMHIFDAECLSLKEELLLPREFLKRQNKFRLISGEKLVENQLWILSASGTGTLIFDNEKIIIFNSYINENFTKEIEDNKIQRTNNKIKDAIDAELIIKEGDFYEATLSNFVEFLVSK